MIWLRGLLGEFGPILVFFVADWWLGFFGALLVMLVATVLATVVRVVYDARLPWFAIVSTLGVLVFGLASVYWQEPDYFIVSDTILDGGFAVILYVSLWWRTPLLQRLFSSTFAISDRAWRVLTWRWATFFLVLAIVNEYIRIMYSEDVWVTYKLLSSLGILAFGCYQFTLSARERLPGVSNRLGLRTAA